MPHYDVVIIGSGAGGGTLAYALSGTGKRVLLLERGEHLPREPENWDPVEVATRGRYRTQARYRDEHGEEIAPYTHHWVGGNTKMYGGALLRLRESDFGEVRHADGISPRWPFGYDELEPYYQEAERLYHVHGLRGADPTEPRASGPYAYPPLPHEPRIAKLFEDARARGLRPFPLPVAVRMPEDLGERSPVRLGLFDGYPDPSRTKADAEVTCVEPAIARGVELWTGAYASRIRTDARGRRATAVVVERRGETIEVGADVVVTACGAIESAALLLRSASEAHPRGLANGSGLVGVGYMTHQNGAVYWVGKTPNDARFQKTFALADWYHGAAGVDHPLGSVQLMGRCDLDDMRAQMKGVTALAGRSVEDVRAHTVELWLTAEDLPDAENRVTLDSDGTIRLRYRKNNRAAYLGLRERLVALLEDIEPGGTYLGYELGVGGVSHQNGTLRAGEDARTSVLDRDCRAHDVENLYAADASFFPSSGAVNPSLTIMAAALRLGTHLARVLR